MKIKINLLFVNIFFGPFATVTAPDAAANGGGGGGGGFVNAVFFGVIVSNWNALFFCNAAHSTNCSAMCKPSELPSAAAAAAAAD